MALDSGEYFVLGDNRNNSEDSRYADMGNIKKRNIIGNGLVYCVTVEQVRIRIE